MGATMATKITVVLEDDLDGGPAGETVRFGIGGTDYEIDLTATNAAAFRCQLAPYIEHARRAGSRQRHRPGRSAASRERSADIRAWAKPRASRSAAASPPTLPRSTKPPQEDADSGHFMAGPKHPGQPPVNDAWPENPYP
jgi:hypothetical protein